MEKEIKYKTLYIKNISPNVTEADLVEVFSQVGEVKNPRIIPKPEMSVNYGFIETDSRTANTIMFRKQIILDGNILEIELSTGKPSARSQGIDIEKRKRARYEAKKAERDRVAEEDAWFTRKQD